MNRRDDRPRGVVVYPMPDEVNGPFDRYALLIREDAAGGMEFRMVHSEGVAYLVTYDKPWTWNDYNPDCPKFKTSDLLTLASESTPVDLADWVADRNKDRLESNFGLAYRWATEFTNDRCAVKTNVSQLVTVDGLAIDSFVVLDDGFRLNYARSVPPVGGYVL